MSRKAQEEGKAWERCRREIIGLVFMASGATIKSACTRVHAVVGKQSLYVHLCFT